MGMRGFGLGSVCFGWGVISLSLLLFPGIREGMSGVLRWVIGVWEAGGVGGRGSGVIRGGDEGGQFMVILSLF